MENLLKKILLVVVIVTASIQVQGGYWPVEVCFGEEIELAANYEGATLYEWNTNPVQYTASIVIVVLTDARYIVNVFAGTTWMLADTFDILVGFPTQLYLNVPEEVCPGTPFNFTGGEPSGGSYLVNGQYAGSPYSFGVGTYEITYEYTNEYWCTSSISKQLMVKALPVVTLDEIIGPLYINTPPFKLDIGKPEGGVYTGDAVDSLGIFHPAIAGVGQTRVFYEYWSPIGCYGSATKMITISPGHLAIEDIPSSKIRIYPNPVIDNLIIEMEDFPRQVQIIDLTGKVLHSEKANTGKIDLNVSFLSKGIYFLRLNFKNGSIRTTKFVK